MSTCDRKCVSKLMARAKRKFKKVDFWIPGGTANMVSRNTGKGYVGWPGLKFKYASKNKDGTPSSKMVTGFFSLGYCPICGGKL